MRPLPLLPGISAPQKHPPGHHPREGTAPTVSAHCFAHSLCTVPLILSLDSASLSLGPRSCTAGAQGPKWVPTEPRGVASGPEVGRTRRGDRTLGVKGSGWGTGPAGVRASLRSRTSTSGAQEPTPPCRGHRLPSACGDQAVRAGPAGVWVLKGTDRTLLYLNARCRLLWFCFEHWVACPSQAAARASVVTAVSSVGIPGCTLGSSRVLHPGPHAHMASWSMGRSHKWSLTIQRSCGSAHTTSSRDSQSPWSLQSPSLLCRQHMAGGQAAAVCPSPQ